MINVGLPCESQPQWGENDPVRRFVNLKASFFQSLADAFERDQIDGLTDETTIDQLAGILYEFDSQGRMKIESKERARTRGIASPDRAEALMLALCKPPQKYEYYSVRDLPRLRGGGDSAPPSSSFPTGFVEVPDRDDEDRPVSLRRQWERILGRPGRNGFKAFLSI